MSIGDPASQIQSGNSSRHPTDFRRHRNQTANGLCSLLNQSIEIMTLLCPKRSQFHRRMSTQPPKF